MRESFPDFIIKKEAHLISVKPSKIESKEKRIKDLQNEYLEALRTERRDVLKSISKLPNENEKASITRSIEAVFKEVCKKML